MKKRTFPSAGPAAAGPWSVREVVDDLPEEGRHVEISAPAEALAGVAELAAVRSVADLSAVFDLAPLGHDGIHVTGRVTARVGQTCVVTLEPIESEVDEAVDMIFVARRGGKAGPDDAGERHRLAAGEDPPEPLVDGAVDLGVIATEFMILGIDPYPRKKGVEFSPPTVEDDSPHPFAALEALKKRPGGGQ